MSDMFIFIGDSIGGKAQAMTELARRIGKWFVWQRNNLLLAAIIVAAAVVVALLIRFVIAPLLRRAAKRFSELAAEIFGCLGTPAAWCAVLIGLSLANQTVKFPRHLDRVLDKLFYSLFVLVFVWGLLRVVGACDRRIAAKQEAKPDSGMKKLVSDLIRRAVKTTVWFVALIFLIQNVFHFNVAALLTGAGVVGLAIAFAAQNTIANIFGALSIVSDEVFKVGDVIDVGGKRGTVESVGFRSTKIRSLDGTLWNMPNRLVADAAIENISARKNIKFAFTLSLVYSTTKEQMQQALDILGEICGDFPGFDKKTPARYSFTAFNSSSLDIGVIVWFNTRDFLESQKMKEELNLRILERFTAAGLTFAYPSVTNYLVNKTGA